ncbi:hypothetical protein Pmani_035021, partial [Petrolisthes manimaculis]
LFLAIQALYFFLVSPPLILFPCRPPPPNPQAQTDATQHIASLPRLATALVPPHPLLRHQY